MIACEVYYCGLTSVQERIVISHIPKGFRYLNIHKDDIMTDEVIEKLVSMAWVAFINPRKLSVEELSRIVEAHRYAVQHSHASMLVFTESFTREQEKSGITRGLICSDIRHNWAHWQFPMGILEVAEPYWNNIEGIRGKMFGDDWCLLTMQTTGRQVMCDSVLAISVAYMVEYRVREVKTFYIKQDRPISEEVAERTGITNEMCEAGITREEAVEYLSSLSVPVIIGDDRFDVPFLEMLYRLCERQFDLPLLGMKAPTALVLNHLGVSDHLERVTMMSDFCRERRAFIMPRRYERQKAGSVLLENVLTVFEQLEARYNVHGTDDLIVFYDRIGGNDASDE